MICPNCQSENKESALFCTRCGTKLERPVKTEEQPVKRPKFCTKCGSALAPKYKFCVKCGAPVGEPQPVTPSIVEPVPAVESAPVEESTPVVESASVEEPTPVKESAPVEESAPVVEPVPVEVNVTTAQEAPKVSDPSYKAETAVSKESQTFPKNTEISAGTDTGKAKNKGNVWVAVLLSIVGVLLGIAVVVACLLFVPGLRNKLPFLNNIPGIEKILPAEDSDESDEQTGDEDKDKEKETENSAVTETSESTEDPDKVSKEDIEKSVNEIKEIIDRGKDALIDEKYDGEEGSTELFKEAMNLCMELTQKTESVQDTQKLVEEAFDDYCRSVLKQVDILNEQEARPELYQQIELDISDALAFSDELRQAGFSVDLTKLNDAQGEIKSDYIKKYIEKFNELTNGKTWSRTEAWDLMQGADEVGLVDHDDPDAPMTQRYAFALARVAVKDVETALADGSMNEQDAVQELENKLKEGDYNLFLMKALADHRKAAGDQNGAKEVEKLIKAIEDHIYSEQGIRPSEYYGLDFYWSFNEFGDDKVDETNGMTKEVHEWIRSTMQENGF